MAPSDKEFIEDPDSQQSQVQKRTRYAIYVLLALIYTIILGVYSVEGIHSRGGQYVWVIVIFVSQIIGFLVTVVFWNIATTWVVLKRQEDKLFLSEWFYDHLMIIEDYKYVQNF